MVSSLPTEIIKLILGEINPDARECVASALAVSSICRFWRAVALSTPSLWSTFSFCLPTYTKDMIAAFFERSLPAPLHLVVSFDFPSTGKLHAVKIERALALFLRAADRIERLHLRFLTPLHGQSTALARFVCFESSGLKFLEMESLNNLEHCRDQLIDEFCNVWRPLHAARSWSERYPALTHVTCTDPRLIFDVPAKMTHLHIKGVPGRRNVIQFGNLESALSAAQTLAELVIDGVSLEHVYGEFSLPHLRALSLWPCQPRYDTTSPDDLAFFLHMLDAPVLASLTILELTHDLPHWLDEFRVCIPSVTRFAVVPDASQSFYYYPPVLPGVEELVLLGSDPDLPGIADLSTTIGLIYTRSTSRSWSLLVLCVSESSHSGSASTGAKDSFAAFARAWQSAFLEVSPLRIYLLMWASSWIYTLPRRFHNDHNKNCMSNITRKENTVTLPRSSQDHYERVQMPD